MISDIARKSNDSVDKTFVKAKELEENLSKRINIKPYQLDNTTCPKYDVEDLIKRHKACENRVSSNKRLIVEEHKEKNEKVIQKHKQKNELVCRMREQIENYNFESEDDIISNRFKSAFMLSQKLIKNRETFKNNIEKEKVKSKIKLEKVTKKYKECSRNQIKSENLEPIGYSLSQVKSIMFSPPLNGM